MDYLNFLVRVMGRSYSEYSAEVTASPVGETIRGTPIPDPLQITALRSKLAANPTESRLRALGTLLFETLFTGELVAFLRASQAVAREAGAALRIQLAIDPNELSSLPWELLFDPGTQEFLALSNLTSVVRYSPDSLPSRPLLTTALPLRILALCPDPIDMPRIDINHKRHSPLLGRLGDFANKPFFVQLFTLHVLLPCYQKVERQSMPGLHLHLCDNTLYNSKDAT